MFILTSSLRNEGIDVLLYELASAFYKKYNGKPYIEDPNMKENVESNQIYNNDTIKLSNEKIIKKKNKCCGKDNKWIVIIYYLKKINLPLIKCNHYKWIQRKKLFILFAFNVRATP